MESSQNQPQPRRPYDLAGASAAAGRITSTELLQGRQQVEIEHGGELYRLRVTKAGKLILTK
jgi:hemin uptake protein HemP